MPKKAKSGRRMNTREVRQRFLIVCEGEQTEPKYFKAFAVAGLVLTITTSRERGPNMIEIAQREASKGEYDQVWCVFDRDDLQNNQIHTMFARAKQYDIQVAFSNQAFELWYLLHFDYCHTAMNRADYATHLSRRIDQPYAKNLENLYELLFQHQPVAMNNAERLLNVYQPWNPASDDPSTTVHLLVKELNKHRRP